MSRHSLRLIPPSPQGPLHGPQKPKNKTNKKTTQGTTTKVDRILRRRHFEFINGVLQNRVVGLIEKAVGGSIDICVIPIGNTYKVFLRVFNKEGKLIGIRYLRLHEFVGITHILSVKYGKKLKAYLRIRFYCWSFDEVSKEDLNAFKNYGEPIL